MDETILNIFALNQLFLNPNYDGEILIYKGTQVDTSETVRKLRESYTPTTSNGDLESIICFYNTSDLLRWETGNGGIIKLMDTFKGYRQNLETKYRVSDQIKKVAPLVYSLAKTNLVCNEKEKPKGVIMGNLICNNYTEELSEEALNHLCGIGDTRFIIQRLKDIYNGNLIDMIPSDFARVCKIKTGMTSMANMIRALGYPYSDYHKFIAYGILVSVDSKNRVYMIRDDTVYCMNVRKFSQYIDDPSTFDTWVREFAEVYHSSDLDNLMKVRLRFFRCMK